MQHYVSLHMQFYSDLRFVKFKVLMIFAAQSVIRGFRPSSKPSVDFRLCWCFSFFDPQVIKFVTEYLR